MGNQDDWHLTGDIPHEMGRGDPFAAAVRATRMPMVITDPAQPDNPIIFCNDAFERLTGYDRSEILGRNCRFLQGPDTDGAAVRAIRDAIEAETDIDVELLNYRKDGTSFWNNLYLSPVKNTGGATQFFFASQLDTTARVEEQSRIVEQKAEVEREVRRRTADLEAALEAKTLLLHEVDHRVKNNLTMIGSLLRLQARSIGDSQIASKLEAMLERVDALATVHRRLYQSDDITRFDMGAFMSNLVSDVIGAAGRAEIAVFIDADRLDVSSSRASALGLVMNEVLTNAIKHAYAGGRPGKLKVSAKRHGEHGRIIVEDDGPGIAGQIPPSGGLGTMLIQRLSKQVDADVTWDTGAEGTRVTITFPLDAA